jgi:hypothetical protein
MKKKLTLLIFLLPFVLFAQTQYKDGVISIDLGGKKKQKQQDTTQQEQYVYPSDEEEEETPKPKKEKRKTAAGQQEEIPDFKRDGLFKGLFHVGLNAAQVDGDNEYGYKHLGVNAGVGAIVRFHKNLSVSLEMAYAMRGARARLSPNGANANFFKTHFDYLEVPVSFNVHDKKLVMFSVGLIPAVLVRYKEWDRVSGFEVDYNNPPFGQPRKFDLSAFGGFYFVIKQHFVLGAKFSYSVLSMRRAENATRVNGQYHNVITVRFMYIMDKASFKKKK